MRLLGVSLSILAIACSASGQTYTINSIAGGGLPLGLSARSASLGTTTGVAVDSAGNVLIVLASYAMVVRIDAATGNLSPVAGNGTAGYSGDGGSATSAQLNNPQGVAVDKSGNVYIADAGNVVVRKVSNGTITTMGNAGGYVSGYPVGIAVDSAGNVYIPDMNAHRIIKYPPGGSATTFAGNGAAGYSGDNGPALQAELSYPTGVAVDAAGNVYIADHANSAVRQVSPAGIITTVAGNGKPGYNGDDIHATTAQLYYPDEVAVDSDGNVYIADIGNSRIRKVTRGVISTVAEMATESIAVDAAGNVYAAGTAATGQVIEISNGTAKPIAGGSQTSGGNGPATSAQLYSPRGVAVDGSGNVFIADTYNQALREVSNGAIASIAGQWSPWGLATDAAGNLYAADGDLVKMVTPAGVVATVAGTGTAGYNGDNIPATSAQLHGPRAVAVDSAGNLYIADTGNNRIRKVSGGVITTVAGTAVGGYNGDGMAATAAELGMPQTIAVDSAGNLYIADTSNYLVREVSNGLIATLAGNGTAVGEGLPATAAQLGLPSGIALDSLGSWYVTNQRDRVVYIPGNWYTMPGNRLLKVSGGISHTIAGDGTAAFGGDGGPATGAQLYGPTAVTVDSSGAVYVADSGNNRIRMLSPSGASCTFSVSPLSDTAVAASGGSLVVNVQTAPGCAWAALGLPGWIAPPPGWTTGAGSGSVTLTVAADPGPTRSAVFSVAGATVLVTQEGVGTAPSILAGGVVNAANFSAPLAPGSIASAFGNFLVTAQAGYTGSPVPTSLLGLSLPINAGTLAPLFFVSNGQVNFQVPWELSGQTQTILAGTLNGTTGAAQTVSLAPFAPAIFATNGQGMGQGAILDSSYNLVDSTHPAAAGSTYVSIYCTGLGPVTNRPVTGAPALVDPLSWTTAVPTVTIGGAPADTVTFYGLAPGYVGLYQVNALVPAAAANGNAVPVTIMIGGAVSNAVTMAVQ